MTQFSVMLLNEVSSVAWRRHQAAPTYTRHIASSMGSAERRRRFVSTLRVHSLQVRGMTLNWFQRQKWKLDIPQRDLLVMNFRRSVIIAELWRPEVARRWKFLRIFFSKNHPLQGNFQNSVPKGFTASPKDVLCSNFMKFGRREIGKVVRYLPDKNKFPPGSLALATARIVPKICRG